MGGICLGICCEPENLIFCETSRTFYALNLENALGKGSGLVHNYKLGMGCRFQIVAAFNKQAYL